MKLSQTPHSDFGDKIEQIEEIISELNTKVKSDKTLTYISKEDYDRVHRQFQILDENIFNHKENSIDSNDRLEELVDIMSSIADLDFSRIAKVGDEFNHLDYIALSINLMCDRLERAFSELMNVAQVFDALPDLHLITDMDGEVLRVNKVLEEKFQIHPSNVVGGNIKTFFDSALIVGNYGLDFERDRVVHNIQQGYFPNTNAKVVLKVTASIFKDDAGNEAGYHYKVKPVSTGFYSAEGDNSEDEVVEALNVLVANIGRSSARSKEQEEVLKEIRQTYMDSSNLSLIETMILNSVNQILKA